MATLHGTTKTEWLLPGSYHISAINNSDSKVGPIPWYLGKYGINSDEVGPKPVKAKNTGEEPKPDERIKVRLRHTLPFNYINMRSATA